MGNLLDSLFPEGGWLAKAQRAYTGLGGTPDEVLGPRPEAREELSVPRGELLSPAQARFAALLQNPVTQNLLGFAGPVKSVGNLTGVFRKSGLPLPKLKTPVLNETQEQAFNALAAAQRDVPEMAMLRAQKVLGGGVLSNALEHVGDLTHRMSQYGGVFGAEYVAPKVRSQLINLTSPYGFAREFQENLRANNVDRNAMQNALAEYAQAHRALPVYNRPQQLARDAAVSLGEQKFDQATEFLQRLQKMIDANTFEYYAKQYRPERYK